MYAALASSTTQKSYFSQNSSIDSLESHDCSFENQEKLTSVQIGILQMLLFTEQVTMICKSWVSKDFLGWQILLMACRIRLDRTRVAKRLKFKPIVRSETFWTAKRKENFKMLLCFLFSTLITGFSFLSLYLKNMINVSPLKEKKYKCRCRKITNQHKSMYTSWNIMSYKCNNCPAKGCTCLREKHWVEKGTRAPWQLPLQLHAMVACWMCS